MHGAGRPTRPCLSVLDLLDAMVEALPGDAYCIVGITDQYIYEGEPTGTMMGRAFGGSRIAMFTTAAYGHALAGISSAAAVASTVSDARRLFAYLLATIAHELGHCFGLDHCGLYRCCMNSWSDGVAEFALAPGRDRAWAGDVKGPCAMCPVCVRKLQFACGFDLRDRYVALVDAYGQLGMHEQEAWCREVLKRGDAAAVAVQGKA